MSACDLGLVMHCPEFAVVAILGVLCWVAILIVFIGAWLR